MSYMNGLDPTTYRGTVYASSTGPLYDLMQCLAQGYQPGGFRRITSAQQAAELMDEIDELAAKQGQRRIPASRRERELAFYREHECADWQD